MEADARYTWVGAAVLALVAALVGAVVWLQDLRGREQSQPFVIHFEHQALDGLEVGAPVNLRGLRVGRVERISLAESGVNRVSVQVRIDRRTPVRTNTAAVVTRNIVTGIAAIALVNPEPAGAPLTAVPPGEHHPVIAEGRSDLDEIAGRVHQLGEQAAEALNNLNQLLTAENRRTVMDTVRQLRALGAGLEQRLASADRALAEGTQAARAAGDAATRLAAAGERLAGSGEELGRRLGGAGERAAAAVERSGARLDQAMAQTEQLLAEARAALARAAASVDAVQARVQRSAGRLEQTASGIDDQLGSAVLELRIAAESATRVLERLRDPRAALLGPAASQLGPGEVLP